MIKGYPADWHDWLAIFAFLGSLLSLGGNIFFEVARRRRDKKEKELQGSGGSHPAETVELHRHGDQ